MVPDELNITIKKIEEKLKSPGARLYLSIEDIDKSSWNKIIGEDYPFLEYEFLKALEVSDSVGQISGWLPIFLVAHGKEGELLGAVPLYLKLNSYGEYIFDWSWVHLYNSCGIPYFPKLTVAIPFTPATGKRILLAPGQSLPMLGKKLIADVLTITKLIGSSSIHWLFTLKKEMEFLAEQNFLPRHTHQFHWHNDNYHNFDDFLQKFTAKRRNQIKRERKRANQDMEIEIISGEQLQKDHGQIMHRFYMSTISKKWAYKYLTGNFFDYIVEHFKSQTIMVMAKKENRYISGAIVFRKGKNLYGRYWGSTERHDCLHFEICYYKLIEYCIAEGIELFEAGAQGEHKFHRGFMPQYTYSAHWIADSKFRAIIAQSISHDYTDLQQMMIDYQSASPFTK